MKFLDYIPKKALERIDLWLQQGIRFVAAALLFHFAINYLDGKAVNIDQVNWAAMTMFLTNRLIPYLRRDLRSRS